MTAAHCIAVLRKEWLGLWRGGRLAWPAVALAVLFALTFLLAHQARERAAAEAHDAAAAARAQWDSQDARHPHRAAHFGLYVFAAAGPLAAFDPGIDRHVGKTLWIEPHRRNIPRDSDAAAEPAPAPFGPFSPALVLTMLLPLAVFALTFDSVSAEREAGTLRMTGALGVGMRGIVLGKLAVAAALPVALVLGAFGLVAALAPEDGSSALLRCAALACVYVLYVLILACVGLTVSALCRSSRAALAVLLALWLAWLFVIPRAAGLLAEHAEPLPTRDAFWSAIRYDYENGLPGDGDLAARGRAFDAALLARHGVRRAEDLPFGAYAARRLARDAYADKVHALHFDALWDGFAHQQDVLRQAALASPAVALQLASMTLAGTDLAHRRHFEDAAERYRRAFNTHIDRWDMTQTRGLTSFDERYGGRTLWQSVPRFDYRPPQAPAGIGWALRDMAALAAWAAAALSVLLAVAGRIKP
ncbi:ABC-2 type transport system permease protein [Pseudoduganella flava]|uniref:ABC-2 type transport system permease protein n=1 Tax=Pseudoduganella flava TaxID=871742 RepID=A0A562PK10_9BURK|nr:DUF3526 domain-containing protein [Pseudoduganella flava]QGZ42237.1 DUF3526 domain-containing protein [Pseudoduganella flava]TWI44774.1 ABC-2 type transport system permease protein [Pseudoduganella flava]